jgi:hypothetical protein
MTAPPTPSRERDWQPATSAPGRVYRSKVAVVHEALADEASRDETFELIRSLGLRAPLDVRGVCDRDDAGQEAIWRRLPQLWCMR